MKSTILLFLYEIHNTNQKIILLFLQPRLKKVHSRNIVICPVIILDTDCWRASETLTGVKMKKSGMFVYLYICMDVRMSFCTLTLAFLC